MINEDHKQYLVDLIITLNRMAEQTGWKSVDLIGVRGYINDTNQDKMSFNDMKSGWFVSLESTPDTKKVAHRYFMGGIRPIYSTKVDLDDMDTSIVDRVASIQYAKKKREIWYNNWNSECPRFSLEEIENEVRKKIGKDSSQ